MNSEVGSLADTWRRAPLQALARLHVLAAAGSVPDDLLGRPRTDPAVAARLAGLAEVATSSEVSGVVVAAVIQGDLLDLEPFGFADPLIARAASRLVLVSRGVDPDALTVPDEGMLRLGSDRLTVGIADYRSGSARDDAVADLHRGDGAQGARHCTFFVLKRAVLTKDIGRRLPVGFTIAPRRRFNCMFAAPVDVHHPQVIQGRAAITTEGDLLTVR